MLAIAVALFFLQASDPVSAGLKALEQGKYEAAAQSFRQAVESSPGDYFSHFNLALAYGYLHRDAEGIAEYRKTLELKPGLYEAQLNQAILLLRSDQPTEALPLLDAAAASRPSEFQPRFYTAEAQFQSGAFDRAETAFRGALELDAKSADARLGLARSLARQGKLAEAEPEFRQAAALDPRYRDALLELGRLYETNGQAEQAIAIYREFPDNPAARESAAALLLQNKQYAAAIPDLEGAYAKDPSAANLRTLAQAYVLNRQLDRAIPLIEKGVAENPADFELRMMYGRALRDRRQFAPAAAQFQQAVRLRAADAKAWSDLGASLYLAGDYGRALEALNRARDLGENTAGNWFFRAIILDKYTQLKPALDAYQQFLALSGGKNPDQEFQARQRVRIIQRELQKR